MTSQPWLEGQVVPGFFFGFFATLGFWDQKWSAKRFFGPPGGHATSENIFLRVCKMFRLFMCIFVCRHYAANFEIVLGKLLICKAQLLEINRAPTAG